MFGLKNVLVGIDGVPSGESPEELILTDPSREAANLALQLAATSGTELTFLTVSDATADEPAAEAKVRPLLESLVAEAAQRNIAAQGKVACGRPWMEVVKEVQRFGHQMVMVGSRQQSATKRMVLGSTGIKLLRKCPCPVWVVRPDPTPDVRTIIVADDLTEVGERCLDLGVAAARALDARLLVLHAVQYTYEGHLRHMGTPDEKLQADRKQLHQEAEQALSDRLSKTDYRTITQGTRVEVVAGRPDLVIEDTINEHAADLVVIGTIARAGIPGLMVGNTAERLLPVVGCSIIAVKPDDFVCPVSTE